MLHLLVASFRALPLDLMVPVSRRRGFVLGFFLGFFFPPFCFFSCPPFFSEVSQSKTRYLSSIVSLDTFAHAHSPGIKCQRKKRRKEKKVWGTIYHFDNEPDLVKTVWIADISPFFRIAWLGKKRRHTAKNVRAFFQPLLFHQHVSKLCNWDAPRAALST